MLHNAAKKISCVYYAILILIGGNFCRQSVFLNQNTFTTGKVLIYCKIFTQLSDNKMYGYAVYCFVLRWLNRYYKFQFPVY